MVDSPYDAILLVSFGGPEGPDDVIPFLENVTAGRNIPRERLAEVGEQYAHFGGVSPINDQCRRQRAALEAALAEDGLPLPVYWGNRNWDPYLPDAVERMAEDGIRRALSVFTSAYSSYSGCRQYRENLIAARAEVAARRPELAVPEIDKVRAYYDHPGFIEPFVAATRTAIDEHGPDARPTLVFTAHSIPTSMAAQCDYEEQLHEAARIVVGSLPDPTLPWSLVWQSRSGPPQIPWLEPDVNDALEALGADGVEQAVIIPIGFVSDHMEVMWDLDTQAVETAEAAGITVTRAVAPGTDPEPAFVSMWVDLVRERIAAERAADRASVPRSALGSLAVRPDVCALDCCPAPVRPAGRPAGARPAS
ncbi:MAG: ferrochelatase [Actinomycetota bacterium]